MQTAVTKITMVADLGTTPATINRVTGEMFLNERIWKTLNKDQRLFILLHEAAHVTLNTTDELEADQWAFEQYAKLGGSLKESVKSLTRVLNYQNPEHYERTQAQLERALKFDSKFNNNPKAKSMDNSFVKTNNSSFGCGKYPAFGTESFFGKIGQGLKQGMQNRQERKEERFERRQDRKDLKAMSKAEARGTLADQGIDNSFGTQAAGVLGKVADGAAGIGNLLSGGGLGGLLGGGTGAASDAATNPDGSKKEQSKTGIIIAVVAVVVVVAVVIFFVAKKGKK
jgi:hypothetical protein